MPKKYSQNVQIDRDSLVEIAVKEMTNLKDPLTVLTFIGEELSEISGQKKRGELILEQSRNALNLLEHFLDEIDAKAASIRSEIGEATDRIE